MCVRTPGLSETFKNYREIPLSHRVFVELVSGCSQRDLCDTPCPIGSETIRIPPDKLGRLVTLLRSNPAVSKKARIVLHGDGNSTMYDFPAKLPVTCDVTIIPDARLTRKAPVFQCQNLNVYCRIGSKTWKPLVDEVDWMHDLRGFTIVLADPLGQHIKNTDPWSGKPVKPIKDFPEKPSYGLGISGNLITRMVHLGKSVKVTPESQELKSEAEEHQGNPYAFIDSLEYDDACKYLDRVDEFDVPMVGNPTVIGCLSGDIWYVRRCNHPKSDVYAIDLSSRTELKEFLIKTPLRCRELCPSKLFDDGTPIPTWAVFFKPKK